VVEREVYGEALASSISPGVIRPPRDPAEDLAPRAGREKAPDPREDFGERPGLPRARESGWLGWASLLSHLEPPGPLLLFPGIFRHATRRGSLFARRPFLAQFFGLGGW
jgi:hypothetical protein